MSTEPFPLHSILYETEFLYVTDADTYLACGDGNQHTFTREQLVQCHPDAPLVYDALLAKGSLDDDKKPCVYGCDIYDAINFLLNDFVEVQDMNGKTRFMHNLADIKLKLNKKNGGGLIISGFEVLVEKLHHAGRDIPVYLGPVGGALHALKVINKQTERVIVPTTYLDKHLKDWRLRFDIARDLGVTGEELAKYVLVPQSAPEVQMDGVTFNND